MNLARALIKQMPASLGRRRLAGIYTWADGLAGKFSPNG
jgi:hypothetical protein